MDVTYAGVALNTGQRESPNGLSVDVRRVNQVVPLTRASYARIFPRKQSVITIGFQISYEKDDFREANDFCALLDDWLPYQGDLLLEPLGSGGTVLQITYTNATLETARGRVIGNTVVVDFLFIAEQRLEIPA